MSARALLSRASQPRLRPKPRSPMIRAHAIAAATVLAIAGAACDSTRPLEAAGTATTDCTRCHGDPSRVETVPLVQAAPPTTARSGGDAGAHMAHLHASPFRAAVTCDTCHVVPTDTSHIDGVASVTFPSLARPNGLTPRWDPKTGTCSGVYCHGAAMQGGPPTTPPWASGV